MANNHSYTITLDNNTSSATATFSGTAKTITGTINGAAAGEGTIVVSGTPTFASTIGNSFRPAQLTINGATTFQAAVQTTLLTTTTGSSGTTGTIVICGVTAPLTARLSK